MGKRDRLKQLEDPAVKWLVEEKLNGHVPTKSEHKRLANGTTHEHHTVMELRTIPITWGIPMDELMYSKFFSNFLHLNIMPWDSVITTESTYLPDARNYIHEIYTTQYETEFLFMLDSDVLPPPRMVESLIAHDKPIVSGWYRKKENFIVKDLDGNPHGIARPVVYDWLKEDDGHFWFTGRMDEGKGLEKVDGVGMGCMLMRRAVAERLGPRPYDMNSGGEDLVLCKKIMDLGIPIHVDWDLACAHAGVSFI